MQNNRDQERHCDRWGASLCLATVLGIIIYLILTQGALAQEVTTAQAQPGPAQEFVQPPGTLSRRGVSLFDQISVNYFGIFHGPALGEIGPYQPRATGGVDQSSPIFTQNYVNLSKGLGGEIALTAQAYWIWQPVLGAYAEMLDPSIRVSNGAMVSTADFSVYSDLRVHIPVSNRSRQQDMRLGLQTFHVAQYNLPRTDLALGLLASLRYNWFGDQGFGRQIEVYAAPGVSWQVSPKLALYTNYEVTGVNFAGDPGSLWYSDGTDLEPGLRWDVSERLMLSPYIHLMVTDRVGWDSTQFGMMVNWILL